MKKLKSGGFTAAACLVIAFGGAPSVFGNCCLQSHTITFSVPGATQTVPTSINSSGAVAGYYVTAPSWWSLGGSYGFVRDLNGTITTFTGPGGGAIPYMGAPFAVLINDSGVVAGTYSDQSYVQHGFVGDPKVAGGLVSFDPPGSILTQVTGINASGSVTGYFYDANYRTHGFVYFNNGYLNGTAYAFDPPPGPFASQDTYASAITAQGDIIGFYYNQSGNIVGFWCQLICSHSDPWFFFGPPAGFIFQSLFYAKSPNPPRPRLVVTGTLFDGKASYAGYVANFGTGAIVSSASFQYPGASNTYPYGINASGVVVGGYADTNFNLHAFLREPNGVLVNVDPPGASGNAWANAINDSGAFTGPVGSSGFITFP